MDPGACVIDEVDYPGGAGSISSNGIPQPGWEPGMLIDRCERGWEGQEHYGWVKMIEHQNGWPCVGVSRRENSLARLLPTQQQISDSFLLL